MKTIQLILIAGLLATSSCAFLTIDDFAEKIQPKCYDFKDGNELINGQVSPIPSSLETFVSIVERLEEQRYSAEKIIRSIIARFRFDDLLYKFTPGTENAEFVTRGDQRVKRVHQILEDLFGGTMNDELKDSDLTEDEKCALYFMISHTVNDTVLPNEQRELVEVNGVTVLKHPREQGVVNLNTRTRHAFSLGKVLLGILVGLQDGEKTISANDIFRKYVLSRPLPDVLKDANINVLHAVTISDVLALMYQNRKERGPNAELLLPNGYWDDSICPTQYILDDNNAVYATKALIRGAVDGLILGKKMKQLKDAYQEIQLSQILRIYYGSGIAATDTTLSEISWCNRHSFFSQYQNTIIDQAAIYYILYAATNDDDVRNAEEIIRRQISDVVSQISSQATSTFDEIYNEADDGCRTVSSGNKICETPREMSAVMDFRTSEFNKEMQYQIIGNLSVGLNMGPGGSSMAVYSNLRPSGGGYKLQTINATSLSGCASCAAKYYGVFEVATTTTENEIEVFRDLNRTLTPDDLSDDSEPGVPSKVVLYFNYGAPSDTRELRNAVWDFRNLHRGTKVFAIGTKKDSLRPFVESVDYDIFDKTDVRAVVTSLKERVCKVPAQFQYVNCYKNSKSDEDSDIYHGFITPYHVQYWAMYPKYFLKSFNIQMSFTTLGGQIKVCFSRNYDEIYGTRPANPNCQVAEGEKKVTFYESNPCKRYNVHNCRPFYFTIEALTAPERKCTGTADKKCRTPNQIEFEFKHSGISCNKGFSFAATPMTLVTALFISISYMLKH